MSLNIKHMTGIEGQVELVGYKAVVASFLRWTLERRGEDGSGKPIWTLRASLSYRKDSMLLNPGIKKRIVLRSAAFGENNEYVCEPIELNGAKVVPYIDKQTDKWTVEGVTLWRQEPK